MNTAYSNYRSLIDSATPDQIAQAQTWYFDAQSIANHISAISGLSLEKSAAIIAAFSPRERWNSNITKALDFVQGNSVKGLTNNINNAYAAMVHGFDALNGLKTNAFARNIAGDMDAVTIDVWMIRAAGMDADKGVNKSQYLILSEIVKDLAVDYRMSPAAIQALIWIVIRGKAE